ncbi:MAG: tetratricopeptide repeat protein [Alphaproteobacteria bacterium]|nr:tetratricopeptide repeat protein [Alphaproteobacteria bacterium]
MSDVFEEVEETIRRERLADGIRKYGPIGAAIFAAIVLGILGYEGYKGWTARQNGEIAMEMSAGVDLLEKGKLDEALKAFRDVAAKGPQGYKALARMEEAGVLVAKGDTAGAIAAYEAAAGLAKEPTVRDSAILRAAYLAAEKEPFAAVEARVKPLIDKSSPYAFLARELLAFEAMKAGDAKKAREHFEFLTLALDAPEGVRQRAQSALALLGPAAPAAAPAAPAAAPAPAATEAPKPAAKP